MREDAAAIACLYKHRNLEYPPKSMTKRALVHRRHLARWGPAGLLGLLGLLTEPSAAWAQPFEGARLLGIAGAERALSAGNDSIYLNPAGLGIGKLYSIEANYFDDFRGSDRRINGSIIDSQAGPVAGGLAYTYYKRRPLGSSDDSTRIEVHRAELSSAMALSEGLSLGVTSRYMNVKYTQNDEKNDDLSYNAFTLDVGLQWRIWQGLAIGLVGYNLTNSDREELPIGWGAGLGWQYGAFSVETDVRYNARVGNPTFSFGAGYVIAEFLPLRAGVSYDRRAKTVAVSAGLGLVLDRFHVDVGYRQLVNGDRNFEDADQRIFGAALRGIFF